MSATATAFSLIKTLRQHVPETAAEDITSAVEKLVRDSDSDRERRTVLSVVRRVERTLDPLVDRRVEKAHRHLATKEDVMAVRENLMDFRTELKGDVVAVRTELAEARTELKGDVVAVRTELAELRTELKGDIASVRTELAELRTELKDDIASVRTELKNDVMKVQEGLGEVREEMRRQHRSFLGVNIAIFGIMVSLLIYVISKLG